MKKLEVSIRKTMSEWHFWVGIAYFWLAFVVVALYFVSGRAADASSKAAKDAAVHQAEIVANAESTYTACIKSIPVSKKINDFAQGVLLFQSTIASNNKDLVESTPKSDPQYKVRLNNYNRITKTIPLVDGVHFPVPTKQKCVKERDSTLATVAPIKHN